MNKEPVFPLSTGTFHDGMHLRDYFAGQALVGILSGKYWDVCAINSSEQEAYKIADAMMEARKDE